MVVAILTYCKGKGGFSASDVVSQPVVIRLDSTRLNDGNELIDAATELPGSIGKLC